MLSRSSLNFRNIIRPWIPPIVVSALYRGQQIRYVPFSGTWDDAVAACDGYDSEVILDRVRSSTLRVLRGDAAFERDGVTFDKPDYSYPLVSGLLRACSLLKAPVQVLDYGGSLGSAYWQCKRFLIGFELDWSVVEQAQFVKCGRENPELQQLSFYESISQYLGDHQPGICLLGGVLSYVKDPMALVTEIVQRRFPFLLIDRTLLSEEKKSYLSIQHVPASIYGKPVRYPAWIISRSELMSSLSECYDLFCDFDALGGTVDVGTRAAGHRGLLFDLKTSACK